MVVSFEVQLMIFQMGFSFIFDLLPRTQQLMEKGEYGTDPKGLDKLASWVHQKGMLLNVVKC